MPLSEQIEKLGRAIFESPFNASRSGAEAPELAEVRLAALDAIKAKSHRVGGTRVFPYNVVRILLRGVPESQAGAFESGFLARYLDQELRQGLARSGYRFPEELQLEVIATTQLPVPGEEWMSVETDSRLKTPEEKAGPRSAKLVVIEGDAHPRELPVEKTRTNLGRTMNVFRSAGPSRRNDLAFTEDNEINRSVSREHAHIVFQKKSGEYRLVNDRWYQTGSQAEANCGLWIVRDGLSQPVHRNTRGAALKAGDEIHLGRAIVTFVQE